MHYALHDCEPIGLGLTASPVATPPDVEMMRYVRNECRAGYAHDNEPIGRKQQQAWWAANAGRLIAYLYRNADGSVVGYGLLRQDEAETWISSVGVLPAHTGRHYGGRITAHLVRQCPVDRVEAAARIDNPAACALHNERDWVAIGNHVIKDGPILRLYQTRPGVTRSPLPELAPA